MGGSAGKGATAYLSRQVQVSFSRARTHTRSWSGGEGGGFLSPSLALSLSLPMCPCVVHCVSPMFHPTTYAPSVWRSGGPVDLLGRLYLTAQDAWIHGR